MGSNALFNLCLHYKTACHLSGIVVNCGIFKEAALLRISKLLSRILLLTWIDCELWRITNWLWTLENNSKWKLFPLDVSFCLGFFVLFFLLPLELPFLFWKEFHSGCCFVFGGGSAGDGLRKVWKWLIVTLTAYVCAELSRNSFEAWRAAALREVYCDQHPGLLSVPKITKFQM